MYQHLCEDYSITFGIGDIYVIKEDTVVLLDDIPAISPIPKPGSIFQWDIKKELLCQLSDNECILILCL